MGTASERLVVIGGDAGGMAAAAQARRMRPDATDLEIVAFERGTRTSFAACGIPFRVGGLVPELDDLVARSPEEHRARSQIDVRTRHDVLGIDLDARTVEVRDLERDETLVEPFDQLLIGTGARPIRPPLPGIDLDLVHGVQNLDDAEHLLGHASSGCRRVVVVGGGYIGLEMAEAFCMQGMEVIVVEAAPQVMRTLDDDMGALVHDAMVRHGIEVRTGVAVEGFEPDRVLTSEGPVPADVVVLGIGVQPNGELAAAAGIETGVRGAIRVDRRQRTTAEGVWAAGDCCESVHLVSQQRVHVALGTVANRQARVAGINIGGGYASFPGVIGSAVTKLCSTEIGRTGLTEAEARAASFEPAAATITAKTRAHYYPGAEDLRVKLVAERGTGRLLGGQIVGGEGAAKRIDVVATAITAGMTAAQLAETDLSYAPPFSPVWDPVLIAARKAAEAADA
ncbi:MAG: FAD-dependent oxidoreductase [Acidimicrobiales bacterium]|nr:FAD-dependent oxidoreductase [Acidimicrobiales bacterium]MCB1259542.1 FAD-dependent oxidoreductase [Acidimicrobiales bacterium]